MRAIEFIQRFSERKTGQDKLRHPAVVVLEFGGGNCNLAGAPSCKDFCAVPNGKIYDSTLDPTPDMLVDQFKQVALVKPAVVSLVPNGEAVTNQKSNTPWGEVTVLQQKGNLSKGQVSSMVSYYSEKYGSETFDGEKAMETAEKIALIIAFGKGAGLKISLTTNGSFLNKDLLKLYRKMGLDFINLSYHPNQPFNPQNPDKTVLQLIAKANEAIEADVIPTITHVLTRQNADTFVALADCVVGQDILFAIGIANARGGGFSTSNGDIEPTVAQVKMVFRRLLARKLFADRHIRTTIPYLLMAPFLRQWVCDQSTDFFRVSFGKKGMDLQPKLNVCSEVQPENFVQLSDFITEDQFDSAAYLQWRSQAMADPEHGCPTCTHQCYFEAETLGTLNIGKNIEKFDWWDSVGKTIRQRRFFRHPIRPVVSKKEDFQNPYLWESLLQGMARILVGLKNSSYWQETFKRSGVDYNNLLAEFVADAMDPEVVDELVQTERNAAPAPVLNWHDSESLQSKFFRFIYWPQRSVREANIALPLKFQKILCHESPGDFRGTIEAILKRKRMEKIKSDGMLLKFIKQIQNFLTSCWNTLLFLGRGNDIKLAAGCQ